MNRTTPSFFDFLLDVGISARIRYIDAATLTVGFLCAWGAIQFDASPLLVAASFVVPYVTTWLSLYTYFSLHWRRTLAS